MYGFGEPRNMPQKRGDSETMPHVARKLSWELVRYLEAQDFPQSASKSPNSAGGSSGWTGEEERLARPDGAGARRRPRRKRLAKDGRGQRCESGADTPGA